MVGRVRYAQIIQAIVAVNRQQVASKSSGIDIPTKFTEAEFVRTKVTEAKVTEAKLIKPCHKT